MKWIIILAAALALLACSHWGCAQSPNATPPVYVWASQTKPAAPTSETGAFPHRAVLPVTTLFPEPIGTVLPTPYYAHTEVRPVGGDLLSLYSQTDYIVTMGEQSGGLISARGGLKAVGTRMDIGFCQPVSSLFCSVSGVTEARVWLHQGTDWVIVPISGSSFSYADPAGAKIVGLFFLGAPGLTVGPLSFTP